MHLEILRYFLDSLDSTEDVNVTDHANYTPLHDAADEGVPQAVQLLLRHGARVDIKNKVVLTTIVLITVAMGFSGSYRKSKLLTT